MYIHGNLLELLLIPGEVKVTHLVSLGHLADDLPSGGVNGREGLPTNGVLPFVVDEQLPEVTEKSFFSRAAARCRSFLRDSTLNNTESPQKNEVVLLKLPPILKVCIRGNTFKVRSGSKLN